MEPRLDLATTPDPWHECGKPQFHQDVEQNDGDDLLEEDKGCHLESSSKGRKGDSREHGGTMGGILEGGSQTCHQLLWKTEIIWRAMGPGRILPTAYNDSAILQPSNVCTRGDTDEPEMAMARLWEGGAFGESCENLLEW